MLPGTLNFVESLVIHDKHCVGSPRPVQIYLALAAKMCWQTSRQRQVYLCVELQLYGGTKENKSGEVTTCKFSDQGEKEQQNGGACKRNIAPLGAA